MFLRSVNDVAHITIKMISEAEALTMMDGNNIESFVGHEATATYLSNKLEFESIPYNKKIVRLRPRDEAIVVLPDLFTVKDIWGSMRIPPDVTEFTSEHLRTLKFLYYLIKRLDAPSMY